jgi:hypothetical protein
MAVTDEMDEAAVAAETELGEMLNGRALAELPTAEFADWWMRWYIKAGHKRLGRLLVQFRKEELK